MPGFAAVVEQMREEMSRQGVTLTSVKVHTWWKDFQHAYNIRTKGSYETRQLAS